MSIIIAILLSGLFLTSILLDKAYRALPAKELKRRVRSGHDQYAAKVFKMASYGRSLEVLLWAAGSLSLGILVLMAAKISGLFAIGLIFAASWLFVASRHYHAVGGKMWRLAAALAPKASYILSHLQPVLGRLAQRQKYGSGHYDIFEKQDLIDMLQDQAVRPHNRIAEADLKLAIGALTFSEKKIADVMQPAADALFVSKDDTIGPLLMDELHKSGAKYFPVVENAKKSQPNIVGTLYIKDIVGHEDYGRVADIMKREVNYINEAQGLHQVLGAFIKTQTHMFIVTNSFEEIVGVITIDKLLEKITGELKQEDDFDRYDNLLAVAGGQQDSRQQAQPEPTEA